MSTNFEPKAFPSKKGHWIQSTVSQRLVH